MTAEALKQTIKVCMFDQYGTVVDMQKGLTAAVAPARRLRDLVAAPHFENSMIDALLHI